MSRNDLVLRRVSRLLFSTQVPIASPWERSEVPLDQSSVGLDAFGGHNFQTGQYHYHKDATALYAAAPAGHAPVVGWLADGGAEIKNVPRRRSNHGP